MAAGTVELYHPGLDGATVRVSERSAYLYRRAGWLDADAPSEGGTDAGGAGSSDVDTESTGDPFDQEEES